MITSTATRSIDWPFFTSSIPSPSYRVTAMQAPFLLVLLASALGASSHTVSPRDAVDASGSPTDQLMRFDSYPDASCSTSSRRGTARVLRGEKDACRTF